MGLQQLSIILSLSLMVIFNRRAKASPPEENVRNEEKRLSCQPLPIVVYVVLAFSAVSIPDNPSLFFVNPRFEICTMLRNSHVRSRPQISEIPFHEYSYNLLDRLPMMLTLLILVI
ncbi:uncharacterized protein F4807DRAFT_425543 [Annulohypoxylon truncatum]|uniref:uncharacterized protein n=1 Tax=Annulohypoxylon truncatum TaxID=327061 RepID=UPI0020072420|nr:uncharacterized protein F4807DRAFT_425543 [Annulohypoxylon truncatum]KAI1209593.1 hypothetical protein F4807DRAFT_425543 [Annulohypoxylon truncatum]